MYVRLPGKKSKEAWPKLYSVFYYYSARGKGQISSSAIHSNRGYLPGKYAGSSDELYRNENKAHQMAHEITRLFKIIKAMA